MMRRVNNGLLLVFLLALCAASFAAVIPNLEIYDYSLSESPAAPGHTVTLTLHIRDTEWATCGDLTNVQVITSYPLSVQGMDTKYLGSICEGDETNGTVSFDIPVDSLAQSGTYQVTIITNYQRQFDKYSNTNTFNVKVAGTPSISASVVSSTPTDIYPGDQAAVTVAFQNNGSGRVESARARMYAPDGIEVKWAGSEQGLGEIAARGSASATFNIEALKNATPGIYKLAVVLDYDGENSAPGSRTFSFDMPVKPKAEFTPGAQPGTVLNADEDKEITVSVKNTGTQEARKLKVRIQPIFPFSTDGTVRYIDSLKPGEAKDLTYLVHVDKDATAGEQISGMLFDYQDPQGNSFTDSQDFTLTVKTKTLLEQAMDYWYIIVLAVLAGGAFVLWKAFGFVARSLKEGEKR